MRRIQSASCAAAFAASLALLINGCSIVEEEQPIPFEISRVVLPKDIPPPADERNSYGKSASKASAKEEAGPDMAGRKSAAEAQEKMHARSVSAMDEPSPSELVKVKVPAFGEGAFLNNKSFVTRWNILGPIAADNASDALQAEYIPGEKTVDGSRNAPDGASWNVRLFGGTNPPGVIDIAEMLQGESAAAVCYATACLESPEEVEGATLLLASSIPVKIWLNGVLVHTYDKGPREIKLDQDAIEGVFLKKGYNRLVVKCMAPKGAADRKFMLRFATIDGMPVSTEP